MNMGFTMGKQQFALLFQLKERKVRFLAKEKHIQAPPDAALD